MPKMSLFSIKNRVFSIPFPEKLEKMTTLLNLSCQSACLPQMKVALKQPNTYRTERSQLHVFIQAPHGQLKSTIVKLVKQHYPAEIIQKATAPKIIGTYEYKNQEVIPSACWEQRNKTIILDEFRFERDVAEWLRPLMEEGYADKEFGRYMKNRTKKDHDLYFKTTKDGKIQVKTRFNTIIATMFAPSFKPDASYDAIVERCIPIYYRLSLPEAKKALEGEYELFTPLKFPKLPLMKIEWRDVKYIDEFVENSDLAEYPHRENVFFRTVGDCIRCFNILGEHRDDLYDFIVKMKTYLEDIRRYNLEQYAKRKGILVDSEWLNDYHEGYFEVMDVEG